MYQGGYRDIFSERFGLMHVIERGDGHPITCHPYCSHSASEHESILHRRPCDGQERLVNTDRHFIDARMQTGEVVRYELLLGYRRHAGLRPRS